MFHCYYTLNGGSDFQDVQNLKKKKKATDQ